MSMNMDKANTPKTFKSKLASDMKIWKMVRKNSHKTFKPWNH